jgi:hypothetical protein
MQSGGGRVLIARCGSGTRIGYTVRIGYADQSASLGMVLLVGGGLVSAAGWQWWARVSMNAVRVNAVRMSLFG